MALVQLMLPGLAFFYAGLLHRTSVVTMIMQNFASMGVVTVLWFAIAFSLCFGESGGNFIGSPATFGGFNNVGALPLSHGAYSHTEGNAIVAGVPGIAFAGYQGMFAVITPALMTGAFADRLRFLPYIMFISLWIIFVYCPFCHWVWGTGWMVDWGVWDFAGGIVVHTTAGFSALAAVHFLGSRAKIAGSKPLNVPHNIPFVALGTALLWFGWFGFNGGSALASTGIAAYAAVNSEIAASTALVVWMIIDWFKMKRPSLVGVCVGAIAGLATITPCAGFVQPWAAFVIGILAAGFCYACCELKNKFQWDDALDVWGVHGMGGALGSVLLGAFADSNVNESLNAGGELFGKQIVAVIIAAVWSYVFTFIILILLGLVIRLKPSVQEISDPDKSFHGESAYTDDAENDSKYAGTAMGEIKVNVAAGKTFLQSMFGSKKAEATTADTADKKPAESAA
jgi:Amt family ammonium transporter